MKPWLGWLAYAGLMLALYPFLKSGGLLDHWIGPWGYWGVFAVLMIAVSIIDMLVRGWWKVRQQDKKMRE